MNPGPCTYAAACIAMRVFRIPVTAGQRRLTRDVLRDRRQGCAIGIGAMLLSAAVVVVALGVAVWRFW